LLGLPTSDDVADRTLLMWWREQISAKELKAKARQTPAVPEHRPVPNWGEHPDPATNLVGPWTEPTDVHHGLKLLHQIQYIKRTSELRYGRAWRYFSEHQLHLVCGFENLRECARTGLDTSLKTLQRHQRLADDIDRYPELAQAVANEVLDLTRAKLLVNLVDEETVADWVRIAPRVPLFELKRAVVLAGNGQEEVLRKQYLDALVIADRDHATNAGGPAFVSLPGTQAPPPFPSWDTVHPDLLQAAKWLLETVQLDRQRGTGRAKERDGYCCQNPECGRRSLRVEVHHTVFRSQGGGDELENLLTLCRACHLRLVHTGTATVVRHDDRVIWDLPGRRIVVFFDLSNQP
jgi:hypothetical protein